MTKTRYLKISDEAADDLLDRYAEHPETTHYEGPPSMMGHGRDPDAFMLPTGWLLSFSPLDGRATLSRKSDVRLVDLDTDPARYVHHFVADTDRCHCGGEVVFHDELGTHGCELSAWYRDGRPVDGEGRVRS